MIKAKVIKDFTLERFEELKNIIRKDPTKNGKGYLYDGDTFECSEEMGKYLTGSNKKRETVIKILEVIPEKDIREVEFEVRSKEVKELVKEKQKEVEEIIKPKKKKSSKK